MALRSAVDGLLTATLSALDQDALLDVVRGVEVQLRRLAAVDHRLVAEVDSRGVAGELGMPSTARLLVGVLRIAPARPQARCGRHP